MKKKLLVVGDSFMRPDPDFPGQHWSEMLPEYEVIMNSQSGASNGIIAMKCYQGLELNPDAVVLGFSFPERLEFRTEYGWTTGADGVNTSSDQRLLSDLYRVNMDHNMLQMKECSIARSVLSFLKDNNIPFVWTLNGLFNDISREDVWVNRLLQDYNYARAINLSTYSHFKDSPGFHTDDPAWQQRFATEVKNILIAH